MLIISEQAKTATSIGFEHSPLESAFGSEQPKEGLQLFAQKRRALLLQVWWQCSNAPRQRRNPRIYLFLP